MNVQRSGSRWAWLLVPLLLGGCAGLPFTETYRGVQTGFFKDYQGLQREDKGPWVQVRQGTQLSRYPKAVVFDFEAPQAPLKTQMPGFLLPSLTPLFREVYRSHDAPPRNAQGLRQAPADLLVLGRVHLRGSAPVHLTLELKLVERATGEEVVRMIQEQEETTARLAAVKAAEAVGRALQKYR